MADNQEKSDDLIAELAKLMASNAQGAEAESESKPSVIKLTPLSEASSTSPSPSPSPSPIRIPGMEAPKPATPPPAPPPAATGPAAGSVRIPGMDAAKPTAVSMPAAPAAQEAPAGDVRPTPAAAFQQAALPRHDPPAPAAAPAGASAAEAAAAFAQPRSTGTPFAAGLRPAGPNAPTTPPPAPAPATPAGPEPTAGPASPPPASPPSDDDHFDFDFGFDKQPPAPQAPAASAPADAPARTEDADAGDAEGAEPTANAEPGNEDDDGDPIAQLINAELGATPASEDTATQKVEYPASVEAVPASNFGHATVQAPVLIGHPARAAAPPAPDRPEAQPTSGDRFAVAPVFGLGSAQPQPQPEPKPENAEGDDPMAEIENLIGEAVRVQLGETEEAQPARQPQPPPVVPPLNTGFAPRRAGLRDVEPRTQSAEAAILAAAAATGAEVGRIEPGVTAEDRPYRRSRVKPPNTSSLGGLRQYIGMGVAAVLLLAAGLGLYWVLNMGRGDPETAPVLTADTSPVKQAPATPAAETAEAPRSVVFDEIDGVAADETSETLVSRDDTAEAPITEVARVVEPEVTETGLANRRVRTVTVRPDGTIVSADDAVAGSEALPVERPNVPELPGAEEPSELLTATAEAPLEAPSPAASTTPEAEDPIAALVAGSAGQLPGAAESGDPQQETTELAALSPEPEAPVVFDGSLTAPVPMPRPTDRSSLAGAGQGASTAPVNAASANEPASIPLVSLTGDAPAATAPAAGGSADAYVQLASLPSEGEARSQVSAMQQRWGNLFGGQSLVVQRAELGGGRVTYRLRLPTSSLQDATRICASIKANGGDCFATNG